MREKTSYKIRIRKSIIEGEQAGSRGGPAPPVPEDEQGADVDLGEGVAEFPFLALLVVRLRTLPAVKSAVRGQRDGSNR